MAYDWHREGNSASLVMHHFKMAHIEACRREQQQPPIGTPPPILQKESNHSSSAEGQPAAANAVTLTKIVQKTQNNNIPPAESGPRKSYTEAVKEGKRQAVTYATNSRVNIGPANLPNPITNGQEINTSILNSIPLPPTTTIWSASRHVMTLSTCLQTIHQSHPHQRQRARTQEHQRRVP